MRRVVKISIWGLAGLAALPALLVGMLVIGANTGPGRRWIETMTPRLSGGMVRIDGLGGRFPTSIRIGRLRVADAKGTWLTVTDAALDWSPMRLLHGVAAIERLEANEIDVARLPVSSGGRGGSGATWPGLPVTLDRLRVARVKIGAAVIGHDEIFSVTGSGTLTSPASGQVRLAIMNVGGTPDRVTIDGSIDPAGLRAKLHVAEAPRGLIAGLAGLPDLGAIRIDASVDGPMKALTTRLAIAAGELRADAGGTIDADARTARMSFTAIAPAMTPAPGVSWAAISLKGRVSGPILAPEATGTLTASDLMAGGTAIGAVNADISGSAGGPLTVKGRIDGIRLPGPDPALLAATPLTLDATWKPNGTLRFALRHALFAADGTADLGAAERVRATLSVPRIAPLAAVGGVDLHGQTNLRVDATRNAGVITLELDGTAGITGGMSPVPALVGDTGTVHLRATVTGKDVTVSRFTAAGKTFNIAAHGTFADQTPDFDWTLHLSSLTALQPTLTGTADAHGHAGGTLTDLSLTGDLAAHVAAKSYKPSDVSARFALDGPPDALSARVTASGTVLDAPLSLAVEADQRGGAPHVTIKSATWKSLVASGRLDLPPGATLPIGRIQLKMTRLADLAPLLGQKIAGDLSATIEGTDGRLHVDAGLKRASFPGVTTLADAALSATITGALATKPDIDATLTLNGLEASGIHGGVRLTGKGTPDALSVNLQTRLADLSGAPARVDAAAVLNARASTLALTSLRGIWKSETLRLLAPTRIGFADGVTLDRLRLGLRNAELELAGRAGKTLDLRAHLTNLPAAVGAVVSPDLAADGTISAEARLTGTPAAPDGTVVIKATGLHSRSGTARGLPPANLNLRAVLRAGVARLDGGVTAGHSHLTLTGTAPVGGAGTVDLHLGGTVDLAIANPILAADGRYVKGNLGLNARVRGTVSAPRLAGTLHLTRGEFQDSDLGVRIADISATLTGDGDQVRLTRLTGKAGAGTISGSGSFGLTGTHPLDLSLNADNARLLASDLITAVTDARLRLTGALGATLTASGTITVRRADIQVPERLPPSVAVLKVRDAGKPWVPPPPPPPPPSIALNVVLSAPREVYVRGRGLDVELGGRILFKGTAARPVPEGGLHLRRGTVSVAGQSLTLTEGTIDFADAELTNPSLKLVATSVTSTLTATLTVSGSVSDPKITLSSVPEMPQDEILSQLLFNTTKSRLSPFQVAQIAAAVASLTGAGSSIGDPLAGVRSTLGLDELSVGSDSSGAPTLEAGRYIAPGVRVGARQSATGTGTQATVQIDITKGLKLETTAGTGSASATGGAAGGDAASVGIKYQFEY
jgi:translocation and assembly module TamB